MGFFKAPHKIHKKVASAVNSAGKKGPHSLVSSGAKGPTAATGGNTPAQRVARAPGMRAGRGGGGGGTHLNPSVRGGRTR